MELDMLIEQVLMEKDSLLRIASVAVLYEGKVAVVKGRSGLWTLPGGRAQTDESAEKAASRELDEETSISVKPEDLVFVGHVQRSKKKVDTIFAVELKRNQRLKAGDDAAEVKWVSVDSLPKLGFGHAPAIKKALKVLKTPPEDRGVLVVFEGVDGSGKSTQVERLAAWLTKHDFPFAQTKWNSSALVSKTIRRAKDKQELTPALYFLLHAADMAHRYENDVVPALERNKVVICDRWSYTGMVRDRLRGIKPTADEQAYRGLRKPDVIFFCDIDPNLATARLVKIGRLGYYGSGSDLKLAGSREENMLEYEKRMARLYPKVLPKAHKRLDMSHKVGDVFDVVKKELHKALAKRFLDHDDTLDESAEHLVDILVG
jgi:dTMP kinase